MGNNEERVEIIGFHGTDATSCKKILEKGGYFKERNKEIEWAGTGIYFFTEENEYLQEAYSNARKWAVKRKNISEKNVRIIKTHIFILKRLIFDLRLTKLQLVFQKYRDGFFKRAQEKAKNEKKELTKSQKNGKIIDTCVINKICAKYGYHAVIMQAYINFEKDCNKEDDPYKFYQSIIPNCTIFCLRNQRYIIKKEEI